MSTERRNSNQSRRRVAIAVTCVLFVVGATAVNLYFRPSNERTLAMANEALSSGRFTKAVRLADRVLKVSPKSTAALMIGGDAATRLKNDELALKYYRRVEDDGSEEAIDALFRCGRLLLESGQAASAEQYLRRVLEHEPSHLEATKKLVYLLRVSARNWETQRHFVTLLQQNRIELMTLAAVAVTDLTWSDDDNWLIPRCRRANDILADVVHARDLLKQDQLAKAKDALTKVVSRRPDLIEAQAWLGALIVQSGSPAEFRDWHRRLPDEANQFPSIWHVRGLWCKKQGENRHAARCFWEVLRRHPNHMGANYQISQVLVTLGRVADAKPFAERSRDLANLDYLIEEGRLRSVAALMESLGRHWEAIAWCRVTLDQGSDADKDWARKCLDRVTKDLDNDAPLTLAALNPASKLDLSGYPLPDWHSINLGHRSESIELKSGGSVSFINSATECGLDFSFNNGADPTRAYMFEFSGGGAAVLDFDGDGWPDLYLTQGCPWPVQADQHAHRDRLFRNLGNGRFQDVTEQSGLGNYGYGQGATVGDFNNDGFPDLYVANIGSNCFYQNNGDGTFSDITSQTGIRGEHWTVSCLVADLNGDTLPDVYDVNYLGGPDVFKRICRNRGKTIQCAPTSFPAEQDQVYINQGDGHFENVTDRAGVVAPDGKGMGIIAADFTGNGSLSLFVSNDTTANFFFLNQSERGGDLAFKEHALLSGLAFNNLGHAESCMGIAAGDANNDGLLDLYVTNFHLQSNNFYLQSPGLLFEDAARQANLATSSFAKMGWGAQFLDGELDGLPDLVVANGHLDDYPHNQSRAGKMPTQYFSGVGNGRFNEVSAQQLGPYFEDKYLGRAIVRLDWNRDGLEDFCVTHVHAPVALLTNQTARHGNYLSVKLRGVDSDRDAIGTKVRVTAGEQDWTRQLIAGDGFEASNERQLIFGLGDIDHVDRVSVTWPSGKEQTFRNLSTNRQFIFVEGVEQPHPVSTDD